MSAPQQNKVFKQLIKNGLLKVRFASKKGVLAFGAGLFLLWYLFCIPAKLFNTSYSTVLYSNDGSLLGARIADDGQWRFPAGDSVPEKFEQAICLFEDEYFRYHPGVNPVSMGRAAIQNIKAGRVISGGSTLSMQVMRLADPQPRTFFTKFLETIKATRLEWRHSKDEILALYANHAPFGGNVVGIEAAAWRYFRRPATQLSWAESALLAVLPNAPSLIHPGKNRDVLLHKRDALLTKLLQRAVIDTTEFYLATAEPLPQAPLPLPMVAPHVLDQLCYTNKGERIESSLNKSLQEKSTQIIQNFYRIYRHNEIHNLAAILIDNHSGRIIAYVGNTDGDDPTKGHAVDIVKAPRSTGSILKPLLYALALDDGLLLPHMLVPDIPTYYSDFAPKNYTLQYDGAVAAHTALSRSLNVPAVRLLEEYRTERFHRKLAELGLTTFRMSPGHYGLSLILGGGEANLLELSSCYATMAHHLQYYTTHSSVYPARTYSAYSWLQHSGKKGDGPQPVLSAGAIYHTLEALTNTQRPEEEEGWEFFSSGRRIAWKTGTSFGNRDAWAIGITPEYTVGVWAGNATGEGRPDIIGGKAAAPVLFELFRLLPSTTWFRPPYDAMQGIEVCSKSGYQASVLCPQKDTLYVPTVAVDRPVCPYHQLVHLSSDKRFQVNADCYPAVDIVHESWFILPPVMAWYYRSKDPAYKNTPPFKEGCAQQTVRQLEIIYPKHNAKLLVPKELDGTMGRIVCKATHRDAHAQLFWHLDEQYLGTTTHIHEMAILPPPGKHLLSITDELGNEHRIVIRIPSAHGEEF